MKRILKPIDELAEKADKIVKFDLSEDKYHLIEERIDSLEPWDDNLISLEDEDLLGTWIVDKHGAYFEIVSREDLGTRIDIVFKKNAPGSSL